jgi:hypothetical protein
MTAESAERLYIRGMRKHNLIAAALAIVTASLGSGCGGSSDSTGPSAQGFAEHLDSLYVAVASDSSMSENLRSYRTYAISLFEIAAAYGVPPKHITVTTSNGIEQWLAFQFVTVSSQDGSTRNAFIATRDADIHTYVYAYYQPGGSLDFAVLNTQDTIRTGSSRRDATSTISLTGSHACNSPLPLQNQSILLGEPCVTAKFVTSGSFTFDGEPNPSQEYRHFAFPATSLDGERLIVP